ncbi:outer membrane efflux protein [Gottschalkia acidurici 9a]|uniref:Outer membrane efflux protein n=1 Tax=Gottschalkia acidurici (strain ATCC 7906 / DSM 604 / BCRC 14475 / CIP 104303 / KCTC 5404 / NCIMB 10678 / 9a) TaxID=1128398 RepID=K0B1C0_GOTA9|nr:TolC family protein [Gottschalkia acidurici]AFS78867.1 outer membrane efflux protein [Gottschalkia acidurici 9a]
MKKIKLAISKVLLSTIIVSSTFTSVAFADAELKDTTEVGAEVKKEVQKQAEKISMEQAVKTGLENSTQLKQVQNQIDISELSKDRTKYLSRKLKDGEDRVESGKTQIDNAQKAVDAGITPQDIVLENGSTIPAGTNIKDLPILDNNQKEQILGGIQSQINKSREQLIGGQSTLSESVSDATKQVEGNLGASSIDSLDIDSTRSIMNAMATTSFEVTKDSYDIYKNQIALLIQKNYYDVLKAQKLLEVKKKSMERGEKQYQFASDSYASGMKAKDDMLLAKVYYKATQADYEKAQGDLNNAIIELRKSIGVALDEEIILTDVLQEKVEKQDLLEGLKSANESRLEIKKALGEVKIHDLNYESVRKIYPENTFQYREAKLLKEKARLNLDKTYKDVEASVRQSYELMESTGNMLITTAEIVNDAKESVEISNYKYREGFGVDNSLLKKLDLESAAGTILDVIAAEENLSQVEEQIVQITYGYNLAKMKYFNDIGITIY